MEFFVPNAGSLDQSLDVFNGVKKLMNEQGYKPVSKPINKIEYTHNSKKETATVGQITTINGQTVIVILECENIFLVCTEDRGVARGEPMLVGKNEINNIAYFDTLPQQ